MFVSSLNLDNPVIQNLIEKFWAKDMRENYVWVSFSVKILTGFYK